MKHDAARCLRPARFTLFIYTAYTLTVASALELPELLSTPEHTSNVAVTILIGDGPPEHVSENTCVIEAERCYLNLLGIASYEVSGGTKIEIKLARGSDPREVRLYLLGTCFGMILHQRNLLAFHASSVVTPKGATLFTGPSGIGKSTLLYTLTQLGYKMLSDDVIGICLTHNDSPRALPSFPRSKLRDDSAIVLGLEPSPEDAQIPNLDKTQLDLRQHFTASSVPVHRIYNLHADDGDGIRIFPKTRFDALTTVIRNTYRAEFLDNPSLRRSHFGLVTGLVNHVDVFDVFRARTPLEPERLARALERHFLD